LGRFEALSKPATDCKRRSTPTPSPAARMSSVPTESLSGQAAREATRPWPHLADPVTSGTPRLPAVEARALSAVEPAPCDDGCKFRERCAAGRLACEAFCMYMAGLAAKRWREAPRAPTRARYEAVVGG